MAEPEAPTVRVWDPLVRIAHWTLVGGVLVAWITGEIKGKPAAAVHDWAGYVVLGVVALRFLWGWVGPRYARFSQFVRPPAHTLAYAKTVAALSEPRYLGHNPLGGWMIVALLGIAALAAGSGWLCTTDRYWGVEWMEDLHAGFANALFALAGLHIAGVLYASRRHAENLVHAMLTGRKKAPQPGDVD